MENSADAHVNPAKLFFPPLTYKSLKEAMGLLEKSMNDERAGARFYDYLIKQAPTQEAKSIIMEARDDARKHVKMLRAIYKGLTGMNFTSKEMKDVDMPASYLEGIRKAFFDGLEDSQRYRDIRAGLVSRYYRDMLFEIMTDEMRHAIKYNYLLAKEGAEPKRK